MSAPNTRAYALFPELRFPRQGVAFIQRRYLTGAKASILHRLWVACGDPVPYACFTPYAASTGCLRVQMMRLRDALTGTPLRIQNVHGYGYYLTRAA